ncbi:MAG: hypothetical protein M3Y80_04750 [Verrucomicrobiota bacterium]|nr:hypothetical protein [Verrucomicrobiota bacterium]
MDAELEEDWLDAKLREEAPYLDDAGFTATVVQQLPAPRQSRSARNFILLGFTVIATLAAYLLSGGAGFLADQAAFLVAMPLVTVCAIAGVCAFAVMAIGGYAAVSQAKELRP